MCGIMGYVGTKPASDLLVSGLRSASENVSPGPLRCCHRTLVEGSMKKCGSRGNARRWPFGNPWELVGTGSVTGNVAGIGNTDPGHSCEPFRDNVTDLTLATTGCPSSHSPEPADGDLRDLAFDHEVVGAAAAWRSTGTAPRRPGPVKGTAGACAEAVRSLRRRRPAHRREASPRA